MSKVRLRLSGVTSFASQIVGYIVGILFAAMVSRRLSERDFGAWAYIGTIASYAILPTDLFGLWITRDAARGRKIFGSALMINLPFFLASLLFFIAFSGPAAVAVNLSRDTVLLGLLVLIPLFFKNVFEALVKGYAYQHAGIAVMIFEFAKLTAGIILVVHFRMGLAGVFIALSLSYALQTAYLLVMARELFSSWIDLEVIKRWLRGSIFTMVGMLNNYLSALDILLMSVIAGSTLITGYWQAALIIGSLVKTSGLLMGGLGQRLLAGGAQKDVDKSLSFTMTLSIPILFGAIVLSDGLLWILRPAYSSAWIIASLLAVSGFLMVLHRFYSSILGGTDTFDLREDVSFRDYARSRVFLGMKISLAVSSIYVVSAAILLILMNKAGVNMLMILTALAMTNLLTTVASLLLYRHYVSKLTSIRLNIRGLIPNFKAASAMAVVVGLLRLIIDPKAPRFLESLQALLILVVAGATVYFLLLWRLSPSFRSLLKDIHAFISWRSNSRAK
ncbi:MAG: hypothetical protein DRN59_03435 [Thaumarchaeota archaeon]|nr:MAG: hypothetical protein DRN59_03435 [Nitrososphaerota archaeon]